MRIVRRPEFMKLPAWTLHEQRDPSSAWGPAEVKLDTINEARDFYTLSIDWVKHPSAQIIDAWYDMEATGKSFPLDEEATTRDGLYEEDALFLIYDRDDLIKLRSIIDKCIEASPK